jgi:hypothetical protein
VKPIDACIRDGKFEFSLAAVMQHPEGTTFKIVPADTRSTTKLRRYLVVCCKYVFYQHPHANWTTWKDAWAALKMEFFFDMVWGLDGTRQKVARSTAGYSKGKLQPMVDTIVDYLISNGLEAPDSMAYNAWTKTAPPAGEEYPPLQRLINEYHRAKTEPKAN